MVQIYIYNIQIRLILKTIYKYLLDLYTSIFFDDSIEKESTTHVAMEGHVLAYVSANRGFGNIFLILIT